MNALVKPSTLKRIDGLVDKGDDGKSSRGKIVESRF